MDVKKENYEEVIRNIDTLIKDMQEENEVLIGSLAQLRDENLELKLFKDRVINIMTNTGTIVGKFDKIKELVDLENQN